ncbi:hypothetical protein GOV14_06940 [Candidatus Pacearchaeota archaeon]|nr:hypothetical protein [Candidatus Pacearchaeota archaeon]
MKTCIVTTIKTTNKRLPGKTFKLLNGKPLYTYVFSTLKKLVGVDVYIDSSDDHVLNIAKEWGFKTLKRPEEYDADHIQGNELLDRIVDMLDYDIIGWILITTPFLTVETIKRSISLMEQDPSIDSLIGIVPRQNRFWYKDKPINHDINNLIGTQSLIPVQEEADFYFIRKESFKKYAKRVCGNVKTVQVNDIEAVDIDTLTDFLFAEALLKQDLVNL